MIRSATARREFDIAPASIGKLNGYGSFNATQSTKRRQEDMALERLSWGYLVAVLARRTATTVNARSSEPSLS